jgi:glutaminyl-tRNA synthetase
VLEDCVRETLDPAAPRAMAVIDPLKVTITNWPEGEVDNIEVPVHPKVEAMGMRTLPFDGTVRRGRAQIPD